MEFFEDLKLIHELSSERFDSYVSLLNNPSGDWSITSFELHKFEQDPEFGDSKNVSALNRFLNNLASNFSISNDYKSQIDDIDVSFRKFIDANSVELETWNKLKGILPKLETFFVRYKELEMREKYNGIEEFRITTDIRPILSFDRTKVSKLTYPCILKIKTCNGERFICECYESTLEDMIKELDLAKEKIRMLKESHILEEAPNLEEDNGS